MQILTVGNMYPPHFLGGYELVWRSAVNHLRDAGHTVRVLASDHRGEGGGGEEPDVHRDLRWYWRDHEFPRLAPRERLALERHNAGVFDRHVAELEPDLVSWWAMGGMSLSLIARARSTGLGSCAIVCDDWLLYGPRVDAWTRAFARRPRLGRVAAPLTGIPTRFDPAALGPALFPSETTRRRAVEEHGLTDTSVCPQGVDTELFRDAGDRPWRWRLLYVGRIDPRKGIALAIRALALLPAEATLTIAGAGDEEHLGELRRLAADEGLGERVTFTVAARDALPELYADADALLFPVLWEEPWGLVPLEAMACGTPVVASGRGGSGEYLADGENSVLFDPDAGPDAIAAAVRRMEGDPELRSRVRAGGLETSNRFSELEWNRAVEGLCEGAAGRSPG